MAEKQRVPQQDGPPLVSTTPPRHDWSRLPSSTQPRREQRGSGPSPATSSFSFLQHLVLEHKRIVGVPGAQRVLHSPHVCHSCGLGSEVRLLTGGADGGSGSQRACNWVTDITPRASTSCPSALPIRSTMWSKLREAGRVQTTEGSRRGSKAGVQNAQNETSLPPKDGEGRPRPLAVPLPHRARGHPSCTQH